MVFILDDGVYQNVRETEQSPVQTNVFNSFIPNVRNMLWATIWHV